MAGGPELRGYPVFGSGGTTCFSSYEATSTAAEAKGSENTNSDP